MGNIVTLIGILKWPVLILIVILMFRNEIRDLLTRIDKKP
jgi:hypothetical protein